MKKLILYIAILLLNVQHLAGVPMLPADQLAWKTHSVDDCKAAVFTIFTDHRGLIWLGSSHGLSYYDGIDTYNVDDERLSGSQIYSIVEYDNRLYLGTNNGLLTYDLQSGVINDIDQVKMREIRTLLLLDDTLWIGGLNGVCLHDMEKLVTHDATAGLPHSSVYSLLRDSRGIIYAGTYRGPARYDAQTGKFYPLNIKIDGERMSPTLANCLLESENHECIYVGCEGALLRYSPSTDHWQRVTEFDNDNVKSMSTGEEQHLLVGTDDGLCDYCSNETRRYRHDSRQESSIGDNEIWCVMVDADNNVWAGHERGFSVASNSRYSRTVKLSSLTSNGEGNEIYAIHRDRHGELWMAGTNGALRMADRGKTHWYRHSDIAGSLSHKRVRAITEDCNGDIWMATDGGINRYDRARDRFDVYHVTDAEGLHNTNWVYALGEVGNQFWVGGFLSGVHFIDFNHIKPGGGEIVADLSLNQSTPVASGSVLTNDMVNNILVDKNGNLWILLFRDKFLNRYNIAESTLEKVDIKELTGHYPGNIALDNRGRVWCAYGGGVVILDNDLENPVHVTFPHTIDKAAAIMAMGPVGDRMWIATQRNMWEVDGDNMKAAILPLPQKTYTAIYDDVAGDDVILGGTDELLIVKRDSMLQHTIDDTVKFIEISAGDSSPHIYDISGKKETLKLPYGGSVSVKVSTLDYSPDVIQRYMYRLVSRGGEENTSWTVMPEGLNTISLSGLKMGKYDLQIMLLGNPAVTQSIPLEVAAPLWLSWWAILLYLIVIMTGIALLIWCFHARNHRRFEARERQSVLENTEKKLAFLSSISHDLKTPLSMIIGPVSILKENESDVNTRNVLQGVYDNAVKLNNMIHRTLELQRLEDSGEDLLILSKLDVVEFCRGVFDVFKDNNPNRKFLFHSSCDQLVIEADAVKLESILTNLLSNACKYSTDGSTISCGVARRDDQVEITVSDDGFGIADADQPLVFERMFRSATTSRMREGTGLGLYLIKKYLELMGGNIELYSKEGEGTAFVVSLPAKDAENISKTIEKVTDLSSGKPKVLIVEDNSQIAGFIMELLADKYVCVHAENGRTGLSIAASFMPDLIIVDEMMPIMTGLDMVSRLKEQPRLATIPIIMLTAKDDNDTENESIKLGIDVFMSKPFEPRALLGRVDRLLRSMGEIKQKIRAQAITDAASKPIQAESVNEKHLARIAAIIEDNLADTELNVNMLCEKSGIPNKQLYRLIKKYMGLSPLDYIRRVRLQKAAVLLAQHRFTVSEVSYMVGFNTPSYFAKCFQQEFGVKPSQYKSDDNIRAH